MIADIMSVLGFLGTIQDQTKRQEQEQELFKATKELIIEFVEFIAANCSEDDNKTEYNTDFKIVMMFDQSFAEQGENKEELVHYSMYQLKKEHKLIAKQINMIMQIIIDMIPSPILQSSLISKEPLYFIIVENNEHIIHQEEIKNNKCYIPNFKEIMNIVSSLNNNEWDSFILTAIRELG